MGVRCRGDPKPLLWVLGVGVATSFVEAAGCHPEAHEISDRCPDFVLQNGHNYNIGVLDPKP